MAIGNPLERNEAIAILKEMTALDLFHPSVVILNKSENGKFDLLVKGDCDTPTIKKFISERNLAVKENGEKGSCLIYKP